MDLAAARIPLPGMWMSSSATSGRCSATSATASSAVAPSPHTSQPSASSASRTRARSRVWSSAITTRTPVTSPHHVDRHRRSSAARGADRRAHPAVPGRAVAHAGQAVSRRTGRVRVETPAVVVDNEPPAVLVTQQADPDVARPRRDGRRCRHRLAGDPHEVVAPAPRSRRSETSRSTTTFAAVLLAELARDPVQLEAERLVVLAVERRRSPPGPPRVARSTESDDAPSDAVLGSASRWPRTG